MRMPTSRQIATIAVLALLAGPLRATPEIPLETDQVQGGRDLSARLTVPVTINGGGPYHFVVDTGAERTVLSRELAQRLTLSAARSVTVLSIAGSSEVQTAMVPDLKFNKGKTSLSDFEAPILSEANLGAVGMLGIDSLQTKRVVMDFRRMRLSVSEASAARQIASDEIVVTARSKLGQLILVDADIDGQPVAVVIDTGSAVSIGNPLLRQRLDRKHRLNILAPIEIVSVTGERTVADYGLTKHLRIGGVTINDMPVAFANPIIFERLGLNRKPALLLGMDVLKVFDRVSVDFANRNVRFLLRGGALLDAPLMAGTLTGRHG